MKAILIDPIARRITEVQHNGDYRQIYELLSDKDNGLDVDDFNAVQIDNRNSFYVDGEGLLKEPRYFFVWRGAPQPYAGRGLILGNNQEGDTVSTSWDLNKVRSRVEFTQLSVQGFVTTEGRTNHSILGKDVPFIKHSPVFGPPDNDDDKPLEKNPKKNL
jgi:hypothetical protein